MKNKNIEAEVIGQGLIGCVQNASTSKNDIISTKVIKN